MDGFFEVCFVVECVDELNDVVYVGEGGYFQYISVVEIKYVFVVVFFQQGIEDGVSLWFVFGEYVMFFYVFGLFVVCEGFGVEGDMVDQVEWIEIFVKFVSDGIEG